MTSSMKWMAAIFAVSAFGLGMLLAGNVIGELVPRAVQPKTLEALQVPDQNLEARKRFVWGQDGGAILNLAEALIQVEPGRGVSGSLVSVSGEGFSTFESVEVIEFGGLGVLGGRNVNTDASGNFIISDVLVPGLDPGIHAVRVEVGTGANRMISSTSFEVLEAGDLLSEFPVEEVLAPLGDVLVRIWHFDNSFKSWFVHDPAALELSDLTVLQSGGVYWIKITEDTILIVNGVVLNFTCTGEDCWNLFVLP